MTDDDALDPVIEARFRALDEVVVPDTRSVGARRSMRWQPWAAAVAIALIVTSVVLVRVGGDDEVIVGAPGTTQVDASALPAPASTAPVVEALAVAVPAIVRPGERVSITPDGVVERYCDKVNVLGPETGSILGGLWNAGSEQVPATFSCDGPVSDEPVDVTVPYLMTGDYRFCVARFDIPEGCALVTVAGPSLAPIEPMGVATPSSAVPGERISIAPTQSVRRTCTDLVGVYGGGTYLGHVGGVRFSPSPGEGDSVPACEGDVSAEALEVVVPAIGPGTYVFCVSDELLPEGCASVAVLQSRQLATTSPIEVVTGDTVTVTPAAPVERICTGWVRVLRRHDVGADRRHRRSRHRREPGACVRGMGGTGLRTGDVGRSDHPRRARPRTRGLRVLCVGPAAGRRVRVGVRHGAAGDRADGAAWPDRAADDHLGAAGGCAVRDRGGRPLRVRLPGPPGRWSLLDG